MMKYSVIHCAASVVSGLSRYQGDATIEVVDNILEDIRYRACYHYNSKACGGYRVT